VSSRAPLRPTLPVSKPFKISILTTICVIRSEIKVFALFVMPVTNLIANLWLSSRNHAHVTTGSTATVTQHTQSPRNALETARTAVLPTAPARTLCTPASTPSTTSAGRDSSMGSAPPTTSTAWGPSAPVCTRQLLVITRPDANVQRGIQSHIPPGRFAPSTTGIASRNVPAQQVSDKNY
jgi:hypothetical protein